MSLQRVLTRTSATATATFAVDGTGTDPSPDSATVTITRDDGTVLVTDVETTDEGTGIFGYTLTPAQTATLDRLRLDWKATMGGEDQTLTTWVEIVGAHIFTLAQARELKALKDPAKVTNDEIREARVLVEQALEDAISCALVPRYFREQLDGERDPILRATWPRIQTIRSIAIAGTALTSDELAEVSVSGRIIHRNGIWPEGYTNIDIAYEHGYKVPPQRAFRAAILLAEHWLTEGPISQRATTWTNPETGVTQTLLTPGTRDMLFALPEVEAFVAQYDHHTSL
jgi:hypothetical protein